MIRRLTFPVPAGLNGDQLRDELIAAGVSCDHVSISVEGLDSVLEVVVETDDETITRSLVEPVLSAHLPLPVQPQVSDAQKIAVLTAQLAALAAAVDQPEIVDSLVNSDLLPPGG